MHVLKSILVLLLLTVLIYNCKKEENSHDCDEDYITIIKNHSLDTIKSSEYIMAYPGSWWEYRNKNSNYSFIDSCKNYSSILTYKAHSKYFMFENKIYVPQTQIGYIHNESVIIETPYKKETNFFSFINSVDVKKNVSWGSGYYPFSSCPGTSTFNSYTIDSIYHLNSITINGNVYNDIIVANHSWNRKHFKNPFNGVNDKYYFFAKNIGLIRMIDGVYNKDVGKSISFSKDTIDILNYFIAPH